MARFSIYSGMMLVGYSSLESGDPPMGVAFGQFEPTAGYLAIQNECRTNHADQSGLSQHPIRWIVEDARKYVAREVRRGSKYDGIILDPPKYGRGANGEVWRLFEDMPGLLKDCAALLADDADFLLLNAYAARVSGLSLAHLMVEATQNRGGRIDWGELALSEDGPDARAIGLSFFARWSQ